MQEIFYLITMETSNKKTLYLTASDRQTKNDKTMFEWSFDEQKAIWWNTYDETLKFGNTYFKNFKQWKIKEKEIRL